MNCPQSRIFVDGIQKRLQLWAKDTHFYLIFIIMTNTYIQTLSSISLFFEWNRLSSYPHIG